METNYHYTNINPRKVTLEPGNYSPNSLTNYQYKTSERIVNHHLVRYLKTKHFYTILGEGKL